jgi:hypothetical protein
MPDVIIPNPPIAARRAIPIAQSMWCDYRVISLAPDYIIDVWPEKGWEHGREAAGIGRAWELARQTAAAGLLLLGCDVAADPDDHLAMATAIDAEPGDVHTGLVKLWPESTGRQDWIWSHRGGNLGNPAATQDDTAPACYFSLGFTWLPGRLLDLASPQIGSWRWGETDVRLSELAIASGIAVHLVPSCRPKHLHFQEEHDGTRIRSRATYRTR